MAALQTAPAAAGRRVVGLPFPSRPMLKIPAQAAARWLARLGPDQPGRRISLIGDHVHIRQHKFPEHLLQAARDGEDGVELSSCATDDAAEPAFTRMFDLPRIEPGWRGVPPPKSANIPFRPRLAKAVTDEPVLWVMPSSVLASMVEDFSSHQIDSLVVCDGGDRVVVRISPFAKSPPLQWFPEEATGYVEFRGVPGLHLPRNRHLTPHVRRSVLVGMLQHSPDRATWLEETGSKGAYTVHYAATTAFVPLSSVVQHYSRELNTGLNAHVGGHDLFKFESYSVVQDQVEPVVRVERKIEAKPPASIEPKAEPASPKKIAARPKPIRRPSPDAPVEDETGLHRRQLVAAFRAIEGGPDHPDRAPLWADLAWACASDDRSSRIDPHKCWIEADWWGSFDVGGLSWEEYSSHTDSGYALLASVRRGEYGPLPVALKNLEAAESWLPVKGVWQAAVRLHEPAGDVLGLIRIRDRLLRRLFDTGLSKDIDLPSFLLVDGAEVGSADGLLKLHQPARRWVPSEGLNGPYVDAVFAYAAARMGNGKLASEMAAALPEPSGPVQQFLLGLYRHRISQAVAGDSSPMMHSESVRQLEHIRMRVKKSSAKEQMTWLDVEYAIQSVRQQSTILEPQTRNNAHALWKSKTCSGSVHAELANLVEKPGEEIQAWVNSRCAQLSQGDLFEAVLQLLPVAPRTDESTTKRLVDDAVLFLSHADRLTQLDAEAVSTARRLGSLFGRAVAAAAHFGRHDDVERLIQAWLPLVRSSAPRPRAKLIELGVGPLVRQLRRLGLVDRLKSVVDEADRLLDQTAFEAAPARCAVAAGLLVCGDGRDRGVGILDQVREELLKSDQQPYARATAADAYAAAAANLSDAVDRYAELLDRMPSSWIGNSSAASHYYAVNHMRIVETMVVSVVDHGLGQSKQLRDWLAQDEFLIRTRMAADLASFRARHEK